jgi:DNA invertase Pin-like site-specific DNA recombinase
VDRPKCTELLEKLEPGDTVVVTKLDRLARSAGEGSKLVKELIAKGINVHILNMGLIEDTPTGRLIMNVLLSFAEFERDMIVERTSAGKAIAKEREDYTEGRPRRDSPENFAEYVERHKRGEISIKKACEEMGVARAHWYRWVKELEVA